jgi:hypothetical protein
MKFDRSSEAGARRRDSPLPILILGCILSHVLQCTFAVVQLDIGPRSHLRYRCRPVASGSYREK